MRSNGRLMTTANPSPSWSIWMRHRWLHLKRPWTNQGSPTVSMEGNWPTALDLVLTTQQASAMGCSISSLKPLAHWFGLHLASLSSSNSYCWAFSLVLFSEGPRAWLAQCLAKWFQRRVRQNSLDSLDSSERWLHSLARWSTRSWRSGLILE